MPNTLSQRDLVSRPDNMDGAVPYTDLTLALKQHISDICGLDLFFKTKTFSFLNVKEYAHPWYLDVKAPQFTLVIFLLCFV